ncbi:hypothetical protein RUND412_007352 [Rhizina undulata]
MPLYQIYHPTNLFTPESKNSLAAAITKIYTSVNLPAFYVGVIFIPTPKDSVYVGGEPKTNWVRVFIQHIAIHAEGPEAAAHKKSVMERIDAVFELYLKPKGIDWEVNVVETDRALWSINGIFPPPHGSREESVWVEENKPLKWY